MKNAQPILLAFALLACHAPPAAKSPPKLRGRTFYLQSSQGAELLSGVKVLLHFVDDIDSLSISANCNDMGGTYKLEGERIVMGDVMQTMMGCDAERHAQDAWLQKFFASKPKAALDGHTLTLASDSSSLTFLDREVADPDRPLQGTVWEINNYIDGETAMGILGIEPPRVTFAADGTWQASSACLDARGRYSVQGNRIQLSESRAADKACTGHAEQAATLVREVFADGVLSYEIEARSLHLRTSGPKSLGATAAEPASDIVHPSL